MPFALGFAEITLLLGLFPAHRLLMSKRRNRRGNSHTPRQITAAPQQQPTEASSFDERTEELKSEVARLEEEKKELEVALANRDQQIEFIIQKSHELFAEVDQQLMKLRHTESTLLSVNDELRTRLARFEKAEGDACTYDDDFAAGTESGPATPVLQD